MTFVIFGKQKYDIMSLGDFMDNKLLLFTRGIVFRTLLIAFVISGGIPDGTGFGTGAVFVLVELSVCLVFWIGNFICFLREAQKIKSKLLR